MNRKNTPILMGIAATLLFGGLAISSTVSAHPLEPDLVQYGNEWTITAYRDASTGHDEMATQRICFVPEAAVGTHKRYRWYSTTYPDWNGRATQEGDQIVMHGDFAKDVGHDAMFWDLVTNIKRNEGAGHWVEWREDGKFGGTIVFANAKFVRIGKCQITEGRILELKLTPEYPNPIGK